jgi:transposase
MRTPIFVRPLAATARDAVMTGLHSPDAFTLRRSQIILASARGERAPQIATHLGCDDQTVRNAIHAFNATGVAALTEGSSRPHRIVTAFDPAAADRLRALLHQSPRAFGKPTSLWTRDLAAAVCWSEGITDERVTGETIRVTLQRLGIRWQRAKQWITSPDPAYARKKGDATA